MMKDIRKKRNYLLAVCTVAVMVFGPLAAQATTIVVADEDFSSASDPVTGSVNNPGMWAANGYDTSLIADTDANMRILSILADPRIGGDAGPNPLGWFRGKDGNNLNMDGIKMFVDGSGTGIVANPGDTVSVSFESYFQDGNASFGLVTDLAAMQASQLARSAVGTGLGVSTGVGNTYFGGVTGVIDITPSGNTTITRVFDNAGLTGAAGLSNTSPGTQGRLQAFGGGNWSRIFFEYVVGSSDYSSIQFEHYDDPSDTAAGTVFGNLNGGSPIPIGTVEPSQIVGFFISGSGTSANGEHFHDNIYITVTRVPEPGTLALIGFGLLALNRFRRRG